jgi:hypothetical protein
MGIRRMLVGLAMVGALAGGSAQAATICNACDYLAPATYLGSHDATAGDGSTFQHIFTGVAAGTAFTDYWVFDIAPLATGSASADFTSLSLILGFSAELYEDGGTVCGGGAGTACGAPVLGAFVTGDSDAGPARWELLADLTPGRYVIVVTGTTGVGPPQASKYTGQIDFVPGRQQVPEPGTLALLAAAVLLLAWRARSKQH